MRNLQEHPITYEEAYEFLDRLKEEYLAQKNIGDMRPLLVEWIKEHVWMYEDLQY